MTPKEALKMTFTAGNLKLNQNATFDPKAFLEASEERLAISQEIADKYKHFFEQKTLTDRRTIFVGEKHPYSYLWVSVHPKLNLVRDQLYAEGYSPTVAADIEDLAVLGEEACMLGIPQNRDYVIMMEQRKNIRVPPVPTYLQDKVGFMVKPFRDSGTGIIYIGTADTTEILWKVPKEKRDAAQKVLEVRTNGLIIAPPQDPLAGVNFSNPNLRNSIDHQTTSGYRFGEISDIT